MAKTKSLKCGQRWSMRVRHFGLLFPAALICTPATCSPAQFSRVLQPRRFAPYLFARRRCMICPRKRQITVSRSKHSPIRHVRSQKQGFARAYGGEDREAQDAFAKPHPCHSMSNSSEQNKAADISSAAKSQSEHAIIIDDRQHDDALEFDPH